MPSVQTFETSRDNLLYGDLPRATRGVTVAEEEGALPRGAVLGKIGPGTNTVYTLGFANATNGTYTLTHDDNETDPISLAQFDAAPVIQGALEALPSIGAGNVAVSIVATNVRIEFVGQLAGSSQTLTVDDSELVGEGAAATLTQVVEGAANEDAGKYRLCGRDNGDGSQVPVAILAEAVDASDADAEAIAYESGQFNERAITLGDGFEVEDVREALRLRGIFLKESAPGVTDDSGDGED